MRRLSSLPFLTVSALFLVALGVRLPGLLELPRFEDEGVEVLWALEIAAGQRWPLTGSDSYYGPLFSYLVAGLFALLGPALVWPRLLTACVGALTVPATYALGRAMHSHRVGLLAALLTLANPMLVLHSHYGWSNSLSPFFTTTTLTVFYIGATTRRPLLLVLGGALGGLAVQTHPLTAVMFPGLIGWYFSSLPRPSGAAMRGIWAMMAGFVLGYAPMLWSFLTGWDALRTRLADQTYAYAPVTSLATYLERLPVLGQFLAMVAIGSVLLLLMATGSLRGLAWWRGLPRDPGTSSTVIPWIVTGSVVFLPVVTRFFTPRYLMFLLPFACVWVANRFLEATPARAMLSRPRTRRVFSAILVTIDVGLGLFAAAYLVRFDLTNEPFLALRDTITHQDGCAAPVFVEDTDALALQDRTWTHFNFHTVRHVLTLAGCDVSVSPGAELVERLALHDTEAWVIVPEQSVPTFSARYELHRVMTIAPGPLVSPELRLALLHLSHPSALRR